jgi:site-specific recombinase XerD
MQLQDAIDQYLLQLEADGRSIHTRQQARRHLRLFAAHAPADLPATLPSHVATFFTADAARIRPDGAAKRATSVNALRSSVRAFFNFAHAAGWTSSNPARLLRRARTGSPPPRALSDADRERLLSTLAADDGPLARRDEMLVRLLLGTGLRIGSAVGLDVGDVDLARGELAVRCTKGDRPETVYLSSNLVVWLRQFIGDRRDGPLFMTASGERLTTRQAARRFAATGAPGSLHGLRHDFATRLLAKSGDLALVQAALRHRAIASTTVYARVATSAVRAAIEG